MMCVNTMACHDECNSYITTREGHVKGDMYVSVRGGLLTCPEGAVGLEVG